jgi:hypothetical protein
MLLRKRYCVPPRFYMFRRKRRGLGTSLLEAHHENFYKPRNASVQSTHANYSLKRTVSRASKPPSERSIHTRGPREYLCTGPSWPFLPSNLFDDHFTPHGQQPRFHQDRLQFEVKSSFVESIIADTLWVQCYLVQSGEAHSPPVIKVDIAWFVVWNDSARRLRIRNGGIRE